MKILLAIDGSPCSDAAVAEVARRPWPTETEVRIITVDPPIDRRLGGGTITAFDELVHLQRQEAAERLSAAAETIRQQASPGLTVTPELLEGWPKDTILSEAEKWGADLIVVGSQGHGALKRLFLGSVSLAVAANAPCSVQIVRVRSENLADPTPVV